MIKKILSLILSLSMICTTLFMPISYAAFVPVTDESLSEAIQKYATLDENEKNVKIRVNNRYYFNKNR